MTGAWLHPTLQQQRKLSHTGGGRRGESIEEAIAQESKRGSGKVASDLDPPAKRASKASDLHSDDGDLSPAGGSLPDAPRRQMPTPSSPRPPQADGDGERPRRAHQ